MANDLDSILVKRVSRLVVQDCIGYHYDLNRYDKYLYL